MFKGKKDVGGEDKALREIERKRRSRARCFRREGEEIIRKRRDKEKLREKRTQNRHQIYTRPFLTFLRIISVRTFLAYFNSPNSNLFFSL